MQYEIALDANKAWWKEQFPGRSEISVQDAAKCLKVKPGKLTTDPDFPSFRDGRCWKVSVPMLARWQTDRAFGKYAER